MGIIHDAVRVQGHVRPLDSPERLPLEFEDVASALAGITEAGRDIHRRCGLYSGSDHNARSCRMHARPLSFESTAEFSIGKKKTCNKENRQSF